jgi:hypothetical protein
MPEHFGDLNSSLVTMMLIMIREIKPESLNAARDDNEFTATKHAVFFISFQALTHLTILQVSTVQLEIIHGEV